MAKGRREERKARWLTQQRADYASPTVGVPEAYRISLAKPSYLHGRGHLTATVTPRHPALKQCSRCKKQKPFNDFGIRNASLDGRHYYCKSCDTKMKTAPEKPRHGAVHVDVGLDGAGELSDIALHWAVITWTDTGRGRERIYAKFRYFSSREEADRHATGTAPHTIVDITRQPQHDARIRELSDEQILKARRHLV